MKYESWRDVDPYAEVRVGFAMYLTITTDLIRADLANRAPNSFAPLASFAVDASIFGLNAERDSCVAVVE